MPTLTDASWWEDTLARAGRQIATTLIPVLTIAVTSGAVKDVNFADILAAAALAGLVTVVRALTGLRAPAGSSFAVDAADRAVAAASGTALALIATDGFDLLHADWRTIGLAVTSSAVLSLVAMFTNTPTQAPVEPQTDAPVIYDYTDEVDTTGNGGA